MKRLITIIAVLLSLSTVGQQRIDSSFAFQTDPAKKYSLYIPSNYNASTANHVMVGLHPFNTARWNAISWCDTLVAFAEANDLILVCPDGDIDGRIDDPIDTAFTSALIDSVASWYNVDDQNIYLMGFSWGGLTTYTYGLSHADRFKGFMPIGAAINGTGAVNSIVHHAKDKPWYLVHGGIDSPGTRYTPLLNILNDTGACTNSMLMSGVGHTIDFPNRNQILTDAYIWLDTVTCPAAPIDTTTSVRGRYYKPYQDVAIHPNPVRKGTSLFISGIEEEISFIQVLDTALVIVGTYHPDGRRRQRIPLGNLSAGMYLLRIGGAAGERMVRFSIQ